MSGNNKVYKTENGGVTWTSSHVDEKLMIRGLHFLDERRGWVVGHLGAAYQTQDGGLSWQKHRFTANRLRSVYFLDEKRGFIAGDKDQDPGSLWLTNDGGRTWRADENDYPGLHRLIRAPGALWAVGKSGTVLRYGL